MTKPTSLKQQRTGFRVPEASVTGVIVSNWSDDGDLYSRVVLNSQNASYEALLSEIAAQCESQGVNYKDLSSEGLLYLLQAAHKLTGVDPPIRD